MTLITDILRPPRLVAAIALVCVAAVGLACDRSPEDLEEWRTARGGMEQLSEWAQDESEPMDVRIRALQIIIEEGADNLIHRTLEGIDDDQSRQTIASAAMPTVQQMWDVQDFPRLDDELLEEGGAIAPDGEQSIRAIEALYRLLPFLSGEEEQAGQAILRDWIADDQVARTQWAEVSIPLLVPLAGEGAAELVTDWLMEANDPRTLARSLRRHVPEADLHLIDRTVGERARTEHPDVSDDMKHAVAGAESDGIVPYLEEVILDESLEDQYYQIAINTLVEVLGEEAAEVLSKAVQQRQGLPRWAAATNILDARGVAGLIDIAQALPQSEEDYADSDDEFNRRATYLCNYVNTHLERGDFEQDLDSMRELLAMEQWTGQALGLQCAHRIEARELREAVADLSDNSTPIAAWGDSLTVGQFAQAVHESLDVADE